jgi:phosphoglycerate kinase
MRVDYNVPVRDGVVTDPKRIYATLPTLRRVLDMGT